MAAVIASSSERSRFFEDPKSFAKGFSLEPAEIDALIEMGPDLGALTDSFVKKREGNLGMVAAKTLEMLGTEGEALLSEFVNTTSMPGWFRVGVGMFGDYVVAQTAAMRDGSPRGEIIAEMARYEKCLYDSFFDATVPEHQEAARVSAGTGQAPPSRPERSSQVIQLRSGAIVERFNWDMRLPYRFGYDAAMVLESDPSELLFFFNGEAGGFYTMRLKSLEARALKAMVPGRSVELQRVSAALPVGTDLDRLLSRFLWQEAFEWL
jgi:hypothetical protein